MTFPRIGLGASAVPAVIGNWVPGVRPMEPFMAFNFAVEIEGLLVGGFSGVTGLEGRIEMTPYREGGVNGYVHQLPVHATSANLVLTHGLTASSALWNWYEDTARGAVHRRNVTVMLLDRRQIPVMWWNVSNALPVAWTGPALDAGGDQHAVESLELCHQGLTKPLLGQLGAVAQSIAGMARA